MKKDYLSGAKKAGKCFSKGFVEGVTNPFSIGTSTFIGIQQGLKYKGDIVRGVKAGATVLGVTGCWYGVIKVFENKKEIENAMNGFEVV